MINIYEAITGKEGSGIRIFLAGGITNCPDWQAELIKILKSSDLKTEVDLYNPRRKNFPIHDSEASEQQIVWEFEKLKKADIIIFWFSRGSLNPIVLYELGMWGNGRETPIIIGIDNGYERERDVLIQTHLARGNNQTIVGSLEEMAHEIKALVDAQNHPSPE